MFTFDKAAIQRNYFKYRTNNDAIGILFENSKIESVDVLLAPAALINGEPVGQLTEPRRIKMEPYQDENEPQTAPSVWKSQPISDIDLGVPY